jgi:hypothetical protein
MEIEVSSVVYEHQPNVQISDPSAFSRVSRQVLTSAFDCASR